MRLALITAGAASALLLFQAPVMAGNNVNQHSAAVTEQPATSGSSTGSSTTAHGSLRAQLQTMLQDQGFSDIRVMPSSFLVRAKDKDGNPVVMSVSPDSMTEVAEIGPNGTNTNGGGNMSANSSGAQFMAIPHGDELSSNVIGLDVYNNDNKNIGQVKDVAWNQHGHAQALILSVGGFLGVGTHYVAVNPQDVKISYNESDKKWHASMNATADQLKAAPEFKYEGRWNASKS
jgi:sporulation protein YlmC with PRC-barrel domain